MALVLVVVVEIAFDSPTWMAMVPYSAINVCVMVATAWRSSGHFGKYSFVEAKQKVAEYLRIASITTRLNASYLDRPFAIDRTRRLLP
jgi:hypothetical protein